MSQKLWTSVDRYVAERLVPSDSGLNETLSANAAAGLPSHEVAPNQGKLLHLLARIQGARRILEIGTLGGYSTIWLARVLPPDGKLSSFDFVFVDADKRNNPAYLKWALRFSRMGTVIVADNVVRDGAVVDPSHTDPDTRGTRAFFEMLAAEPRLDATAIQTVGVKGYDGFCLAVVVK
jgi:predicted O-methyltransferase YrrM